MHTFTYKLPYLALFYLDWDFVLLLFWFILVPLYPSRYWSSSYSTQFIGMQLYNPIIIFLSVRPYILGFNNIWLTVLWTWSVRNLVILPETSMLIHWLSFLSTLSAFWALREFYCYMLTINSLFLKDLYMCMSVWSYVYVSAVSSEGQQRVLNALEHKIQAKL